MNQERSTNIGRTQVRAARAIGYVRVSRVAGRAGESFISPEVQRETIAAKVSAGGLELVGLEEDLDASGGTYERPGFQRALEAVERGEASVIVVARLTRFARSVLDTHRALERIERAGGRLVACDIDVDTSTATGRMVRGMLATLAEFERELVTEQWASARSHAIARGVKISHTANLGYRFDDAHRLVPDKRRELVLELFERRAGGASWTELEELLDRAGVKLSRTTLRRTLANRVYLGESRHGELVAESAHEAIVPLETFEAVQRRFASEPARSGASVRSMLAGYARCGTCGARMSSSMQGTPKQRVYVCRNRECGAPASITARRLDGFVEDVLFDWAGELADEPVELELGDRSGRAGLEARIADAELALEAYVTAPDMFGLEPAMFRRGLEARQANLERLRGELDELADADEASLVRATLREAWPTLDDAD
jgi:DNA invertase Pin-like site-specific DNA recombinase